MPSNRPHRERIIKIRVFDDQYLFLRAKAKAAGMTVTEMLRDHGDQIAVVNRTDWRLRTYQLAAIGNCINQIARWANTHKGAADAHHVVVSLLRLERVIRAEYGLDASHPDPDGTAP